MLTRKDNYLKKQLISKKKFGFLFVIYFIIIFAFLFGYLITHTALLSREQSSII